MFSRRGGEGNSLIEKLKEKNIHIHSIVLFEAIGFVKNADDLAKLAREYPNTKFVFTISKKTASSGSGYPSVKKLYENLTAINKQNLPKNIELVKLENKTHACYLVKHSGKKRPKCLIINLFQI